MSEKMLREIANDSLTPKKSDKQVLVTYLNVFVKKMKMV